MKGIRHAVIVALSLAGVGVVLLSTTRYGVGVSPDSAGYISAARNLVAGEGLRRYDGSWYTSWPPLFPLCLAAVGLAGIDPAVAARFLNAFALGGITLVGGMLLERCLRSKWLVVIGSAAILLGTLLLGIANMAWSEPVFLLLIALFVFWMPAFLNEPRARTLVIVSLLAALCSMQRYTGVAVIASGAILILLFVPETELRRRLRRLVLFLAISCAPLALWAVRNYTLTSTLSGAERVPSIYTLGENVTFGLDTVSQWFVPDVVPPSIRTGIVGLFFLLSLVAIFFCHSRLAGPARRDDPFVWPIVILLLAYIPLMVYTHQVGVLDETLNDRYLSPVSVLTVCLLCIGMDRVTSLLRAIPKLGLVVSTAATALVAVWLVYPATVVWQRVRCQMRDGAGGYMVTSWNQSSLVQWLRDHRPVGELYSNAPDAVYALTEMRARVSPLKSDDMTLFRERLLATPDQYLIWFSGVRRSYMHDRDALISMFRMEKTAVLGDGVVYRLWSPDERAFSDGLIFSPCEVQGKWSRTFVSDKFGARGVIPSWIMKSDGTTDSTWVLDTGHGAVLRWQASCPYARADGAFAFHCEGRATQEGNGSESSYVFSVQGTVDANTATGTYRVEFANPQWPPADSGTWRVDLAQPVYRFYHPAKDQHLYVDASDKMSKLASSPGEGWVSEGIAWYRCPEGNHPFDARPVYQFHSSGRGDLFCTANEREKDKLMNDPAHRWSYEGIVCYAIGPDTQ